MTQKAVPYITQFSSFSVLMPPHLNIVCRSLMNWCYICYRRLWKQPAISSKWKVNFVFIL